MSSWLGSFNDTLLYFLQGYLKKIENVQDSEKKHRPHFQKHRLNYELALLFILGSLCALTLTHSFLERSWVRHIHQNHQENIALSWQSAIDSQIFPTLEDLEIIGIRLMDLNLFKGVTFYDNNGDNISTLGEDSTLTMSMIRVGNILSWYNESEKGTDFYIAPETIGTDYHLILHYDDTVIAAKKDGYFSHFILFAGIPLVIFTLFFTVFLYFLFLKPLKNIQNAFYHYRHHPQNGNLLTTKEDRLSAMGSFTEDSYYLLESVFQIQQHGLHVYEKILEHTQIGVLIYDIKGNLMHANPKVSSLMRLEHATILEKIPSKPISIGKEDDLTPLTLRKICRLPDDYFSGFLNNGNSVGHPCLFNKIIIHDQNNEPMRTVLLCADMAKTNEKVQAFEKNIALLERHDYDKTIRLQEMKQLLESCLCLLAGNKKDNTQDTAFLPDRILNSWYEEAQQANLVSGNLEHNLLPWLYGNANAIRNVFRQAMLVIYARSLKPRPTFFVEAQLKPGNVAEFIIKDVSQERIGGGATRPKQVDWKLPLSALRAALVQSEGHFINFDMKEGAASLSFSLTASRGHNQQPKDLKKAG